MDSLAPDENRDERELLVHLSRTNTMSLYLWSELADIMSGYDEDSEDDMMGVVDARLQELAYTTTFDRALATFDAARLDTPGLWAGRYGLFDDAGVAYVLYVNDASASLVTPDGTLDEHTFSGGTLRMRDDRYAVELAMILPLTDAQMEDQDFELTPSTPTQPRCEGTITILSEGKSETRRIRGKRDSFTPAGVDQVAAGDPPESWCGVYQLIYTDKEPWTKVPDSMTVAETGGSLKIGLGSRQGIEVLFASNTLHCVFDTDGKTKVAGYFVLTDVGNVPRFFGVVQTEDGVRSVTGYWTHRGLMAKLAPGKAQAAGLKMALSDADPNAPPETARTFPIDLTDLPMATKRVEEKDAAGKVVVRSYDLYELGSSGDGIVLLKGVETHDYAVILEFKNLAPDHPSLLDPAAGWTWRMADASPTAQLFIKLRHSSAGTYWLDASMGETQSAGWHYFALEQVIEAGTPAVIDAQGDVTTAAVPGKLCRIWLDLEGISRNAIVITPTELPPIILNHLYDVGITGDEGEPPLIWSLVAGAKQLQKVGKVGDALQVEIDGIEEIKFDMSALKFVGTLTKEDMALTTHPVQVQAESQPRVVMKPSRVVFNLRVEPEISSADQKNIKVGGDNVIVTAASIAAGLLGVVGLPLVIYANHKYRTGKRYSDAKDVIKTALEKVVPTKQQLVDEIVEAHRTQGGAQAGRDAARQVVADAKRSAGEGLSLRKKALREAELAKDHVGADHKIELEREISKLEFEISEIKKRIADADRVESAVDHASKKSKGEHAAFENHLRGKV